MGLQRCFDLTGGDVFARAADDVLVAIDKVERALFVLADRIAGVEPAAAPGLSGRWLIFVVCREKAAAGVSGTVSHQQLTGCAYGNILVVLVYHAGFKPAHRSAEGARAHLSGWVVVGKNPASFGHAPDLHHGKAESCFRGRVVVRVNTGTDPEANAVIRFRIARRQVHQQRRHHAQVVDHGCSSRDNVVPPALGVKTVGRDQTATANHHAGGSDRERVHVVERQGVQYSVGIT